jgi:hypothetical protein
MRWSRRHVKEKIRWNSFFLNFGIFQKISTTLLDGRGVV